MILLTKVHSLHQGSLFGLFILYVLKGAQWPVFLFWDFQSNGKNPSTIQWCLPHAVSMPWPLLSSASCPHAPQPRQSQTGTPGPVIAQTFLLPSDWLVIRLPGLLLSLCSPGLPCHQPSQLSQTQRLTYEFFLGAGLGGCGERGLVGEKELPPAAEAPGP